MAGLRYLLEHPEVYDTLERVGSTLESALSDAIGEEGCVQRVGAMMTLFFGPEEVRNFDDASKLDRDRFGRYFRSALDRGVLLPPSGFEAMFLMESHADVVDEAASALVSAIEESR